MKRGNHRAGLLALIMALVLLMTSALAEEVAAPELESSSGEAEAFVLGEYDAPAGEAAPQEEAAPVAAEAGSEVETEEILIDAVESADYVAASQSISVRSSAKASVYIGDTLEVLCTKGAFTTLSSSKPGVADVVSADPEAGTAVFQAYSAGKTRLKAKLKSGTATVTLTVLDPYVATGVSLPSGKLTVDIDKTLTLEPTLKPATARTTLTWSSSKPKVATVTDGVVTPVAEGTAKITVKTANGKKATATVKVVDPYKPTGIAFADKTLSMNVTETLELVPVLQPDNARTTLTWTSSKPKVAAVKDGVVSALSEGKATVTVRTANGRKASIAIVVADPYKPTGVALTAETDRVDLGGQLTLTPVLTPETAVTTYTWTTSSSKVATVADGVVTGHREGTAKITVRTANGKKAVFTVKVTDPTKPLSVSLPAELTVIPGDSVSLTAELTPDTASTQLTWTSSSTKYVTVADGVVTGVKVGSATVTVKTANGLKATCKVSVVNGSDYRALLVGNDSFYDLNGAGTGWNIRHYNSDAVERMRSMLSGIRSPLGDKYQVTTKIDLNLAGLKNAIATTFADADEDDVSLFYLASHGQLYTGQLVMASLTEKAPEYMSVATLRDLLLDVPGKVIVIFDTCGSGASIYLAKSAGGAVSDGVVDQLADFNETIARAFAEADPGVAERVSVPEDDDARIFAKTGELRVTNKFYVLCSAAYNEESWAYANGSFFTDWVAEGVGKSGSMPADTKYGGNSNGKVDLYELYKYVSSVGDDHKFPYGGKINYQHVQVYPSDTRFEMFS